jgi:hypothetical protein
MGFLPVILMGVYEYRCISEGFRFRPIRQVFKKSTKTRLIGLKLKQKKDIKDETRKITQDKPRQDKTRQDKTRQHTARQHKI